jgi:hypothetical protein
MGGSSTSGTEEKAQTEKKAQTETAKDRAQATKDAIRKTLNQTNDINRSTEGLGR